MKKKLVLLSAALLAAGTMAAQTVVKGRVLDQSGNPVAGASVKANGKVVALTDNDGNFSISKLPAGVKRVSIGYVGMNVQTVDVSSNMNVTLTEANTDLDEVMVVAYGTTKKSAFCSRHQQRRFVQSTNLRRVENPRRKSGRCNHFQHFGHARCTHHHPCAWYRIYFRQQCTAHHRRRCALQWRLEHHQPCRYCQFLYLERRCFGCPLWCAWC